jgi:hypothetical protein
VQGELKETLYFDEAGIVDLSEQIGLGRLKSFTKETEASREGFSDLKPKFSLGALSKLIGGPEFGIEGGYHRSNSEKERTQEELVLTRTDHLKHIIEKLGTVSALKMTLDRAWHLALAKEGGVFCIINDLFSTISAVEPETWLDAANRAQFLQLTDISTCQFRIGMSFSKIVGVVDGRIHPIGHLAFRLGRSESPSLSLTVFGKMDKSRYIKPFVVSWN